MSIERYKVTEMHCYKEILGDFPTNQLPWQRILKSNLTGYAQLVQYNEYSHSRLKIRKGNVSTGFVSFFLQMMTREEMHKGVAMSNLTDCAQPVTRSNRLFATFHQPNLFIKGVGFLKPRVKPVMYN
jgi:hypothetical protein